MLTIVQNSFVLALCASCLTAFLCYCYKEGEIFSFWGAILERLPERIANPLGACVFCHGTWVAFGLCYIFTQPIVGYVFCAGFTYILLSVFLRLDLL